MIDADHQEVIFPLSGTQATGYAPTRCQIVGIPKQMKEEMQTNLAEGHRGEIAAACGLGG